MANDFVVVCRHVAQFSRKAGFPGINLPVDDDAHTQSPAQVDEEDVFLSMNVPLKEFTVGHGSCVVVYRDGMSYSFGDDFREGTLLEVEPAVAVARIRVDSSGDVDVDVEYLFFLYVDPFDELVYQFAKLVQSLRGVFAMIGDVHFQVHHISFEVHQPDVDGELLDVYADEVAGLGIQTVQAGAASAVGALLAILVDVPFLAHLIDELGDGWNT